MSDTKLLQAILDGQTSIRNDIKEVKVEVKKNGERIDKIGLQLANLEDDSPTVDEFDDLEKRVSRLEKPAVSSQ
ncbi:MAG: hypothetical protein AAB685_03325 [Patescibacteria group bacterium]